MGGGSCSGKYLEKKIDFGGGVHPSGEWNRALKWRQKKKGGEVRNKTRGGGDLGSVVKTIRVKGEGTAYFG